MSTTETGWLDRHVPPTLLRWEGGLVLLATWACLLAVPLSLGQLGLGSDALNHHIYLGWTAEQHRFDRDFVGAGYQAYQFPYLFWAVYRMAVDGWTGTAAGMVLATLHLLVVWPLWMLARACIPGVTNFDLAMRGLAVALGLLSAIVVSAFTSTINDVLAAAPLVWAVAFAMEPATRHAMEPKTARRRIIASGVCGGIAVAWKLSNGPLAVFLPALWFACSRRWSGRLQAVAAGSLATLAGFAAGYGYWGWLLWRHFGNPVFPFYHHWFAPLRDALGWVAR